MLHRKKSSYFEKKLVRKFQKILGVIENFGDSWFNSFMMEVHIIY